MRTELKTKTAAALVSLSLLALGGCSSSKEKPYEDQSVAELYNKAYDKLKEGEYKESATLFDEVSRQHPYSSWAQKAQIMEAYAQYRGQKYDNVIASLEAFVGLHPASPDVPYALYMIGLSYYEQISPATRDQQDTMDAIRTFNELVSRFPASNYAKDARAKIIFLTDVLAEKSMEVGRHYLIKGQYQAAINRFQLVVERYQNTRHVEEALYRIVECYLAMGIRKPASDTAAVLGHNYPNSEWYKDAYALLENASIKKLNMERPRTNLKTTDVKAEQPIVEESTWQNIKKFFSPKKTKPMEKPARVVEEPLYHPAY